MTLAARLLVLRAAHAVRRAERARRRRLEQEMAAYSSAADRQEIEAILDRYPDGLTRELRSILACQHMRAQTAATGLGIRAGG